MFCMLHFEPKHENLEELPQQNLDDTQIKKTNFDLIKFFENTKLYLKYFHQI